MAFDRRLRGERHWHACDAVVEAYTEDLFRDVLRAFDNLEERASEKAKELFNKYPVNEYADPGDVADWAHDHSYSWLETDGFAPSVHG
jgi:hypothetical protein